MVNRWICILFIFSTETSGQTLSGSNTSYAVLNRPFQFTCSGSVTATVLSFIRDETSICTIAYPSDPARCAEFTSSPGYSCSCGSSGFFHMNISEVSLQDGDRWKCGTGNFINLPVYYKPSVFGLPDPFYVTEHTDLSLDCSSYTQSNPAVTSYRWTGPGGYSNVGPVLSISNINRDKTGDFTCTATNSIGTGTGLARGNVQYKPSVSGFPDPFYVTEHTDLSLNCSSYIQSKPAVTSYRWTGPGGYSGVGPVLSISSINRDKTGDFTCTARNTLTPSGGSPQTGTGSLSLTVRVQYAPQVQLPQFVNVTESSALNINCSQFTTLGQPISTSFQWAGPNGFSSSGLVMLINNIQRSRAGNYSCTASNTLTPTGQPEVTGSDKDSVNIHVLYGPGSSVSISPQTKLERVEGSGQVTVTCSADCFPPCSFKWMMGDMETESHQLHISNVSRTDRGSYSCEAWNGVGERARRDFALDVFYLDVPVLSLSKKEVRENDTVEMSCEVVSNPTVQMIIENIDNRTELFNKLTNRENYTVQHARCLHNGVYRCTADNQKTGTSLSAYKTLSVPCYPRPDFRIDLIRTVSSELNRSVSLKATFIANPAPSFFWYRVENDGRAAIGNQTVHKITNSHFSTSLQINLTHTRDYSDYAAVAENDIGNNAIVYTLTSSGSPYPPLNPVITQVGSTFLGFEWISDYNSGSDQTFHLELRTSDSLEWKPAAEVRDPGLRKTVQTNLTDLSPSTTYHIRLYSKNQFGTSDNILLNGKTLQGQSISGKENGLGFASGLGLGIGSCVFVLLAVLVGVFLYKRHRRHLRGKCNSLGTEMNQDFTQTENSDSQRNVYESLDSAGPGQTYEKIKPGIITRENSITSEPKAKNEKTALYVNQIKLQESDGDHVYYNQEQDLDT